MKACEKVEHGLQFECDNKHTTWINWRKISHLQSMIYPDSHRAIFLILFWFAAIFRKPYESDFYRYKSGIWWVYTDASCRLDVPIWRDHLSDKNIWITPMLNKHFRKSCLLVYFSCKKRHLSFNPEANPIISHALERKKKHRWLELNNGIFCSFICVRVCVSDPL